MIIHYSSRGDEKIFNSERLIKKYYTKDFSGITNRLSELRAANSLNDIPTIPPPLRHKLHGNYADCWGIRYSPNDRFVVRPYGTYDINDLTSINEITIVSTEDYH